MKREIVEIYGHSAAKVVALAYAVIGLGVGVLVLIMAIPVEGFSLGLVLPVILLPALYGALGYLSAWLFATLYNVVAKRVGGITIRMINRPDAGTSPDA